MTMAELSEVDYINVALGLIGEKAITALSDNSKGARWAQRLWEVAKRETFRLPIAWKFAKARAELSQLSATPAFGWDYQYALPAALVRIRAFVDEDGDEVEYAYRREIYVSASTQVPVLLCNQDECRIKYIVQLDNVALWPAEFARLCYLNIAIKLAKPLTRDLRNKLDLGNDYEEAYNLAKAQNGAEDTDVDASNVNVNRGNTDVVDAAGELVLDDNRYIQLDT